MPLPHFLAARPLLPHPEYFTLQAECLGLFTGGMSVLPLIQVITSTEGCKVNLRWVCNSVCLSVSVHSQICKNDMSELHEIFCIHTTCSRGSIPSDDSAVHYVYPVLWMTECFHTIGPIGHFQIKMTSSLLYKLLTYLLIYLLCYVFAFSALTLLSVRKYIRSVKNRVARCGVIFCLERGADCLHMVQMMPMQSPKTHSFLPHLNPDWFYRCGTSLPRLSWTNGH